MTVPEALQTWLVALEDRHVTLDAFHKWADELLQRSSPVSPWLVEMTEAKNVYTAIGAIGAGLDDLCGTTWPLDPTSLRLGLAFLRYQRGDLSLFELLAFAGEITDCANYDAPDCEAFYHLLGELDESGPSKADTTPLVNRAASLFAPHVELVRATIARLAIPQILGDAPTA